MSSLRAPLLALAAMLAMACAGGSKGGGEALTDRTFVLQSTQGAELLSGSDVHLHFFDNGLSVQADCNSMSGPYKLDDDRVVMDGLGSTEMGCDAERHAQDAWLGAFLVARPKLKLEGAKLTLSTDEASLVFLDRKLADPDRPLAGTVWEVNTYIEGEGAMGLMGIENPRITFAADGTWRARSTCLEASGRYTVQGDRVTLSGAQAKQGECVENEKTAADFVRAVMVDGELTFEIEARALTLKANGPRSLGANAVQAP